MMLPPSPLRERHQPEDEMESAHRVWDQNIQLMANCVNCSIWTFKSHFRNAIVRLFSNQLINNGHDERNESEIIVFEHTHTHFRVWVANVCSSSKWQRIEQYFNLLNGNPSDNSHHCQRHKTEYGCYVCVCVCDVFEISSVFYAPLFDYVMCNLRFFTSPPTPKHTISHFDSRWFGNFSKYTNIPPNPARSETIGSRYAGRMKMPTTSYKSLFGLNINDKRESWMAAIGYDSQQIIAQHRHTDSIPMDSSCS